MPRRFITAGVIAVLILAGCQPYRQKPLRILPPKQTAVESIAELANNAANLRPVKASSGRCLFRYNVDGKQYKENFSVKLWFSPPNNVYLQGDVALDPRAICLGSNETEFWFSIKPEVSTCWWGRYEEVQHCFESFLLNPGNLLEAFGILAIESPAGWTLSKQGEFDVLTEKDNENALVKKVYVNSRDYFIRKIEYFSPDGQLAAVTELDKYKDLEEGLYLPTLIKITSALMRDGEDSIKITLKGLKEAEFSRKVFVRRPPKRFRHIKKLNSDCEWVEQEH